MTGDGKQVTGGGRALFFRLPKQITMTARGLEEKIFAVDFINQHPIGLDVAIPVACPVSG